jgi:glycosyltransferase involved in cell wall biosynthesis
MTVWHVLTPEYPPQPGGVSDYTYSVAGGLAAAGDEVHVWCPAADAAPAQPGVVVHRALGRFRPADLSRAGRALDAFPGPRRILLQWVPHGFGMRAMNVPLCAWLAKRSARGDAVEVMFHEAFLEFRGSWRQHAAAGVHRLMVVLLLRAARRAWYAVPRQETVLRPYCLGRRLPFAWLPVPSNVPVVTDPGGVAALRGRYAGDGHQLVGHFGTYGASIAARLEPVLLALMRRRPAVSVLLLGRGGGAFRDRLARGEPAVGDRLSASGGLDAPDLSRHLQACDLMLQPYPDGVSCRRTSFMAALAHGRASVTTLGHSSEAFWATSDVTAAVADLDGTVLAEEAVRLLADGRAREQMGRAAARAYCERYSVQHTVTALRGARS